MPPLWDIQRLGRSHNTASFDCGKPLLNRWLQQLAGQYERRDLARSYVAVATGHSDVSGYYALSNHYVCYESLPEEQSKGLPIINIPVVLLGRLAVDRRVQRHGLGEYLLLDALRRVAHISQHVGVRAVEVHALDSYARSFYRKYGFAALRDDQHHLFLSMQVVRQLKLPPL